MFGTWEWADTWWRHFGEGGELRTRLVPGKAILPLYVSRTGPFRLLRFIGHGHADELGPVGGPDDREAAAGALREALADDGHHLFSARTFRPDGVLCCPRRSSSGRAAPCSS